MEKLISLAGQELASLRAKGYTADQIAALSQALQDIIDDINQSLQTCENHVNSPHAPADAEPNTIVAIKKNGNVVAPDAKVVDLNIPTKVSELQNDSHFRTAQEITDEVVDTVNNSGHIKKQIVEEVPAPADADPDTIYYVRMAGRPAGNRFNEYQLIEGHMELVGTNDVDLSGYATVASVAKADDALIRSIVNTLASSSEKYVGTGNLALFWSIVKPMHDSKQTAIDDIIARLELIEMLVKNEQISGNPFSVTFESLDGVVVEGVWNKENNRIDF